MTLSMSVPPRAVLQRPEDLAWFLYERPVDVFEANSVAQVLPTLRAAEAAAESGLTAVGFITYEAASAFDPALRTLPPGELPLAWFAAFEQGRRVGPQPTAGAESLQHLFWQPSIDLATYRRNIERIHGWIEAGDTYQVNYTLRLEAPFDGDVEALFDQLTALGDSRCGARLDTGRHALCSLSPELFFQLDGDHLLTRPMKGTAERGRTNHEDQEIAETLRRSIKNRAENVMIVDMMRNDLGRIARPGTVTVPYLWQIERYRTLFQMTSTCEASTDAALVDILAALFPSASITGAPKVRTMELITEVETSPRGIYTGAIGRIGPGRSACFNVAIRTVHVDRDLACAEYGTGGGIVWDSTADEEFEETRTKALVVSSAQPRFSLLETIRWDPQHGFTLLGRHLDRLLDSAAYFGRTVDRDLVEDRLAMSIEAFNDPRRVRLLVSPEGDVEIQTTALPRGRRRWRVALARGPIDPRSHFLFHKTTHRNVYDSASHDLPGIDDVILWNPRGELTESTVANLVVRRGDDLLTPPIECGLLPGTARAELLERGRVREDVLLRRDLPTFDAIYLVNSVRGWIPTTLVDAPETLSGAQT